MDRINPEPPRVRCPLFADKFVGRQALEGLEPTAEVVGSDEVAQALSQLGMIVIMKAFDSGLLDGPVHSLDLSIGPRVLDLGQAMPDTVFDADPTKDVLESVPITSPVGELDPVIGQHRMKGVGHRLDQILQELRRHHLAGLDMKLGEREL